VESAEEGSAMKEIRASGTVLMQTKGGGKHDILPVGRATATTPDCMGVMPRDPDADICVNRYGNGAGEHRGVHGASKLRSVSGPPSRPIQPRRCPSRAIAGFCMIERRRSWWQGSRDRDAQL